MPTRLEKALDIPANLHVVDQSNIEQIDMETASLDTVIQLSLKAYQEEYANLAFVEGPNRIRHLEVTERFLTTAKDAMYKKETLLIQREKIVASQSGQKNPVGTGDGEDEDGTSRKDLFDENG